MDVFLVWQNFETNNKCQVISGMHNTLDKWKEWEEVGRKAEPYELFVAFYHCLLQFLQYRHIQSEKIIYVDLGQHGEMHHYP